MNQNNIECPHCGHKIDVNDILYHQVDETLKKQYADEAAKKEAGYKAKEEEILRQKQILAAEKIQQDHMFAQRIEAEKKLLHQQLKQQLESEQSAALQALQQENDEKSRLLKDFNQTKIEVERLKREKEEQKAAIEADAEVKLTAMLLEQEKKIRKSEESKLQVKLAELADKESAFQSQYNQLLKQKTDLEEQSKQQEATLKQRLQIQAKVLEEKLKKQIEEEKSLQIAEMEKSLDEKTNQLKEFNQAKSQIERLKREKDELRDALILEKEQEFSAKLNEEKLKIQKVADENSQMKIKEKDLKVEELTRLVDEMKRKAEQGSMQSQGEVQELAIEAWLSEHFPLDVIEEVKKGARGADCLQIVHTHHRQNCGSIYYESKRTKDFQASWIEKFKNDIRDKNATIGVLVTEVMPNNMERLGLKDGVWVCTFEEFKSLCWVLREQVIRLSEAFASQENKGDKMELLYNYLTSNEFHLQVEGIVEGFSQMQSDLDAEKRAMARIWKQREKQLEKVLLNTTQMHGSIRGIAGSAIQPVALLELGAHVIE